MKKPGYSKRRLLLVTIGAVGLALADLRGLAQSHEAATFEAASVKPVDLSKLGDQISTNIASVHGQEITFGSATLRDCIRFAYGMAADAQIVGPEWIRSKQFLYDIDAKTNPGASREELQEMMRTLLAERFPLVTRREQKGMSYYALVPAKRGATLPEVQRIPEGFQAVTQGGHIESYLPMPMLGYLLSRLETERPIIDKTGLSGMYRIRLDWALENTSDAAGPSLFTALEEQLGLRLEARKGRVEIVVVDGAEKRPTPN